MNTAQMRMTLGPAIVVVHATAFAKIMLFTELTLSPPQRFDVAMLLIPVTVAYFMAVVRSAVRNKASSEPGPSITLEYLVIAILVSIMFLGALLFAVFS